MTTRSMPGRAAFLAMLLAALIALAMDVAFGVPAQSPAPAACSAAPFRQFDFWIGAWSVATPNGKPAGTNQIARMLDGCALTEQWSGAGGSHGTSISYYDPSARAWFQTWVDDQGQPLRLRGGMQGERMVLEAESADSATVVVDRVSWTPLAGGRVRQHWERSSDGRRSWATVFDGIYTPEH